MKFCYLLNWRLHIKSCFFLVSIWSFYETIFNKIICFLKLNITIFSFIFLSPNLPMWPLILAQIYWLHFFVCTFRICKYNIYSKHKYNLFSLFNASCMYMISRVSTWYYTLGNQLSFFFLHWEYVGYFSCSQHSIVALFLSKYGFIFQIIHK